MTRLLVVHAILAALWLGILFYCHTYSYADPSSIFYDEERAYHTGYSALRESQADEYISNISTQAVANPFPRNSDLQELLAVPKTSPEEVCVGIPSTKRESEQFLRRTIASLSDSLTTHERALIHVVVLLADDNPLENPAYGQGWLEHLADEVLVYSQKPGLNETTGYRQIPHPPLNNDAETSRNEHVRRDYRTVLESCQKRGSSFFLLVEDDVIASRDWLQRLRRGLSNAESTFVTPKQDWFYIRLFYSETYLGWNNEELPIYSRNIILVYVAVFAVLFGLEYASGHYKTSAKLSSSLKRHLRACGLFYVWTALFIILYFMAGRLLVNNYRPGLREMPQYGCCAQGLAFPYRHLENLKTRLTEPPYLLPGDSLIESVAESLGHKKLALVPSVLQHVGRRGSSAAGGVIKTTWNFSFEKLNV